MRSMPKCAAVLVASAAAIMVACSGGSFDDSAADASPSDGSGDGSHDASRDSPHYDAPYDSPHETSDDAADDGSTDSGDGATDSGGDGDAGDDATDAGDAEANAPDAPPPPDGSLVCGNFMGFGYVSVGDGGPQPCGNGEDYTCNGDSYEIICECPAAACTCSKNKQPVGSAPYNGCPTCTQPSFAAVAAACGVPY